MLHDREIPLRFWQAPDAAEAAGREHFPLGKRVANGDRKLVAFVLVF
jgi:hypothetical protein